jgi:hypothetical protein
MHAFSQVRQVPGNLCSPHRVPLVSDAFRRSVQPGSQRRLLIDPRGGNISEHHSRSSFLSDRTAISVKPGTQCNESVYLSDFTDIAIYAYPGPPSSASPGPSFTLIGQLSIQNSRSVHIYGVNVTNPDGDGIAVNNSSAVTLEDVSSSNNAGAGLNIGASTVTITHVDSFDYNRGGGVLANSNSSLNFNGWWPHGADFELIGNSGCGIKMDRSVLTVSGNMNISDTVPSLGGSFPDAFGIIGWGGATGGLFDMTGPNRVINNRGGGIFLAETSEMSMGGGTTWATYPLIIQGNGPYGIYLEFGAQITIYGATQILDHTIAGVDVYANSQANIFNGNQITHNGTGLDPGRAGLRVEGNSQAYVRGITFSQNGGPGILGLVNSSVDLGSSAFSSNAGGAVLCDGSAVLKSDLPSSTLGTANACRVAPVTGIQRRSAVSPPASNLPQWKAYINKMHTFMEGHHN